MQVGQVLSKFAPRKQASFKVQVSGSACAVQKQGRINVGCRYSGWEEVLLIEVVCFCRTLCRQGASARQGSDIAAN